jgi:hypothetical protein
MNFEALGYKKSLFTLHLLPERKPGFFKNSTHPTSWIQNAQSGTDGKF